MEKYAYCQNKEERRIVFSLTLVQIRSNCVETSGLISLQTQFK